MKSRARKILSLAVSLSLLPIIGCGTTAKKDGLDKSDAVHIKITLTNNKEIEADLYPHIAPKSVENFVNLINENFFDGLIFHRVIEGFMIQGGFTPSAKIDLVRRGIKDTKFDTLEGTTAADDAQYALALIVDDKVVEIYEILAD